MTELKLTICQDNALIKLKEFLSSDEKVMAMRGAGGTGKSFVLKFLVQSLQMKYQFVGPTNKSVNVLRESSIPGAMTIHKYLSFILTYDDNGEVKYKPNYGAWDKLPIDGGVVFFDESSMVDDIMYEHLIDFATRKKAKIVFIGDDKQLPPIKSTSVSKSFDCNISVELVTNKRCANQQIAETHALFRKYTFDHKHDELVNALKKSKSRFPTIICNKDKFVNLFVKRYLIDNNTVIIACSNKQVDVYNACIKSALYGDGYCPINNKYFNGMILAANGYFNTRPIDSSRDIAFYTSDIATIIKTEVDMVCNDYFDGEFKCFVLVIEDERENTYAINFIHPHDEIDLKKRIAIKRTALKCLKTEAMISGEINELSKDSVMNADKIIALRKIKTITTKDKSLLWKEFHDNVSSLMPPFISSYCITAYKSQGSTYNNVFVDYSNITRSRSDAFTQSRELYTSISRARERIYLFTSNLLF
jgi:hypothetical protein